MDCSLFAAVDPVALNLCNRYNATEDKLDSVQTLVYIVAGVGGGIALVILILVIAVVVQLTSLRSRVTALTGKTGVNVKPMPQQAKESSRFGGDQQSHNGQQFQQPPPQSRTQQPQGPAGITSEEELAHLGFAAYTGAPVDPSRGIGPSPLSPGNNGGVRVLPRNPPTGFRNNASYNNDGFH